jgi:hypothetical protein
MNIAKHHIDDICLEDLNCLYKHQDKQEKRLRSQNKAATTRPRAMNLAKGFWNNSTDLERGK